MKEKGIPVKHPASGDSVTLNGIEITILNPQKNRGKEPDIDAVAMKIKNGDFCVIIQSDVEMGIENAEVGSGISLKCPVLSLGKHGAGSANSFLLIDAVQPKEAIISVGPNDRLEPNPTVLERLIMKKITVYRTDQNGTISIISDGKTYTIYKSK